MRWFSICIRLFLSRKNQITYAVGVPRKGVMSVHGGYKGKLLQTHMCNGNVERTIKKLGIGGSLNKCAFYVLIERWKFTGAFHELLLQQPMQSLVNKGLQPLVKNTII